MSRVGFGGIPIQRLGEADAVRVVLRCLDLGVTFLDTAHGYGTSEQRIGSALTAWAGRREDVIIATKTPARDKAQPFPLTGIVGAELVPARSQSRKEPHWPDP